MTTSMKYLFIFILGFSSVLALSSDTWFQLWVSLEVNMMVFIPLMFNNDNLSINSSMKYFIVQTFASSLFIFSMLMGQKVMWLYFTDSLTMLALCSKLGLFPLFFWFPQVSEGLTWVSFTLLSTWQKIIPMYMLSSMSKPPLMAILTLSAVVSCLGAINQSSLRKLFAYSSISHMSWMLLSMLYQDTAWALYFTLYSVIMVCVLLVLKDNNTSSIHHLKQSSFNFVKLSSLTTTLMSLGGLPPFMGFLPKWLIITSTPDSFMFALFVLVASSLIMIFTYLRILFPLLFNKTNMTPWSPTYSSSTPLLINSLMLIPLIPMIFF